MTNAERQLRNQMNEFDSYDSMEAPRGNSGAALDANVGAIQGNPIHKAQFTLNISNVYYDVGNAAVILPAALPAALQVSNPFYVFGQSDFSGNYKRARQNIPFVNGGAGAWNFSELGILGKKTFSLTSAAFPTANEGDMLFISTATAGGNDYARIAIVSCPQVAYGTLLDSLSSDTFDLNMIRYVVDPTLTIQLAQQITILRQTLFGKTGNDGLDPQVYITGGTYNRNIADIPAEIGVDKNLVLGSQIEYNVQSITWIVTVFTVNKLTARV